MMNSNQASGAWRYRPDIDGLRALAVVAVMLYHAELGCPGGFVGVDVFFVISGYLITGLLAADLARGTFTLAGFWDRRIGRIWPAALVVTATTLLVGSRVFSSEGYLRLAQDALAQLGMVANVRFWWVDSQGYFAPETKLMPLLHMWSLAVEEQFYLVFPALLMLLWRLGRSWSAGILGLCALASFLASVWCIDHSQTAVFYLLPFRAWELLLGSLLALVAGGGGGGGGAVRPRWVGEACAGIGLGLVFWTYGAYDSQTLFPGMAALPPCLGALLLIYAGAGNPTRPPLMNRILSTAPLVATGRVSYSLYLWHWPILVFARYDLEGPLPTLLKISLLTTTVLVGYLSWRYVEQPFRHVGLVRNPGKTALVAGLASGVIGGYALQIILNHGFLYDVRPKAEGEIRDAGTPFLDFHSAQAESDNVWRFPAMGVRSLVEHPDFLLWGDSHARVLSGVVDSQARLLGLNGIAILRQGRVPLPGIWREKTNDPADAPELWREWDHEVIKYIQIEKPKNIIITAFWSFYLKEAAASVATFTPMGSPRPAAEVLLRQGFDSLLSLCEETGATLWVLRDVPDQRLPVLQRAVAAYESGGSADVAGVSRADHELRNRAANEIFASLPQERLHMVDLAEPFFGVDELSRLGSATELWFKDANHISAVGVDRILTPTLRTLLEEIRSKNGADSGQPVSR